MYVCYTQSLNVLKAFLSSLSLNLSLKLQTYMSGTVLMNVLSVYLHYVHSVLRTASISLYKCEHFRKLQSFKRNVKFIILIEIFVSGFHHFGLPSHLATHDWRNLANRPGFPPTPFFNHQPSHFPPHMLSRIERTNMGISSGKWPFMYISTMCFLTSTMRIRKRYCKMNIFLFIL